MDNEKLVLDMPLESSSGENDEKKLLALYEDGYSLFEYVSNCEEPTNSVCVQNKVKQAMRIFEDATRLTSMAGIFSTNENVAEVATENLRLFLLPALLGTLALKLTGNSNRIEIVETSDTYFRDFLQRCNDYEISNIQIQPPEDTSENQNLPSKPMFDLAGAARNRAHKIQRYKEEKMLEEELAVLRNQLASENVDDEIKREFYLKLIKSYVTKAEEELDCLQAEKKILAHMKNVQKSESLASNEESKKRNKLPPPKPLKPIIITKDQVQKAVFGAGYPSLPTMTVQEFYDKRVADGIFPSHEARGTSLQDMSSKSKRDEEDLEAAEKEKKEELEDEEEIARKRAMDEFKDENKRGWGNRYNRS